MNLNEGSGQLLSLVFRAMRAAVSMFPGGRISALGTGPNKISSILIVNLDRQPTRWRRMLRELGRFRTCDGKPLTSIATRFAAVDARDGRAVAATADVDPNYRLGDQLHVQPDARLEECFGADEPIRMTHQEVAVARSHVEVWKTIARGSHEHVLVLEDDVWFTHGAAAIIDRGWRAALDRCRADGGPNLLYLSYQDADGSAERADPCASLFRPVRGLWFLSGYVLSREGAASLLRAMPVVGPVDMWINYRFEQLGAFAVSSPAILQRQDCVSDNSYSILPYLARAGIVDAGSGSMAPEEKHSRPVLAWSTGGDREGLAMALSMLGLRVRAFDGDEEKLSVDELQKQLEVFDGLVDAPLTDSALTSAVACTGAVFVVEEGAAGRRGIEFGRLPMARTAVLPQHQLGESMWEPLCDLLGLSYPAEPFPAGARRDLRLFRHEREEGLEYVAAASRPADPHDDSPWVLPSPNGWHPRCAVGIDDPVSAQMARATVDADEASFSSLVETFPGNLASFAVEGVSHDNEGTHLTIEKAHTGRRPFRSGAFASNESFMHGRFEAEIRAAAGSGFITGLFLHRDRPRQEIDIEIVGDDPRAMLVNVYFNPGDEGTAMAFGYRGTPYRIDLGFDATDGFHRYSIDWRPGLIAWAVDGKIVHERRGWDPTPLPHLPMRLHANLWAPRSQELAGPIDEDHLPARAAFRNVTISG